MMSFMQTARLQEQLSVVASADSSCSVFWLLPDDPAELAGVMSAVVAASGLRAHGFAA
jgi:hypothetical protein